MCFVPGNASIFLRKAGIKFMKGNRQAAAVLLGVLLALPHTGVQSMAAVQLPVLYEAGEDEEEGVITEVTTTVDDNKTIVVERVLRQDGTEDVNETVTEELESGTIVTEKLESTNVNASLVITRTYDTDDAIMNTNAVVYIGVSSLNNDSCVTRKIPESFIEFLKEANIKNVELCAGQPAVTGVKGNGKPKMLVKVIVPKTGGISVKKVTIPKESISSAVKDGRKLVVKIASKDPLKSYTVTMPQSEMAKVSGGISVAVKTGKVPEMASGMKSKVQSILSANGIKEEYTYTVSIDTVSIAGDKTKTGTGIKVTTPVLFTSVKPGSSVYIYHYNNSTGRLEEIANSRKNITSSGMAAFEGYIGRDYVVTSKELKGKNVVTLLGGSDISFNKLAVKKGSSIKINTSLATGLVKKTGLKAAVPYGSQAAVIKYKSSDSKVAGVSKDGVVKAKSKGKAVITVQVKLAGGKVKTVSKNITVK